MQCFPNRCCQTCLRNTCHTGVTEKITGSTCEISQAESAKYFIANASKPLYKYKCSVSHNCFCPNVFWRVLRNPFWIRNTRLDKHEPTIMHYINKMTANCKITTQKRSVAHNCPVRSWYKMQGDLFGISKDVLKQYCIWQCTEATIFSLSAQTYKTCQQKV